MGRPHSTSNSTQQQEQQQQQRRHRPPPDDAQLVSVLQRVQLGHILQRHGGSAASLDQTEDWASVLSLGEQQRLAFARCALGRLLMLCRGVGGKESCHIHNGCHGLMHVSAVQRIALR